MDGLLDLWLNSGMETRGPVLRGDGFVLRPPEPCEFDRCTELRNAHRRWFADDREVPVEAGRRWLEGRTERDCLLVIDVEGEVVGTVGWVDLSERVSEVGRVVHERAGNAVGFGICAVALSAQHLARHRGRTVYMETRPENRRAKRLVETLGAVRIARPAWSASPGLDCWLVGNPEQAVARAATVRSADRDPLFVIHPAKVHEQDAHGLRVCGGG